MRARLRIVLLLAALVPLTSACEQQTATADGEIRVAAMRPVFGGACKICPWGAVGEFVKAAMAPYGYEVLICSSCNGARYIAERQTGRPFEEMSPDIPTTQRYPLPDGPPDFGAVSVQALWRAYQGTYPELRLLATIQQPNYFIVAVKADLGITDLAQIREKRWPVRILMDRRADPVLAYYDLTRESIAGRSVGNGI